MPETNERRRERYKNDPEYKKRNLDRSKRWRENNKQHCKDYEAKHYVEKSEKYAEYYANYRKDHKQKVRKYNAEYQKNNMDKIKIQRHEHYLKNRDVILKRSKKCREINGHEYYLTQKANGCNTSEATRKHNREHMARRRNLGNNMVCENRFEGRVDDHHLSDQDKIPVPKWIHDLCKHPDKFVHRALIYPLLCQLYPDIFAVE